MPAMEHTQTAVAIASPEEGGAAVPSTALLKRPVLLYSGTCRFCRWSARLVAAIDHSQQLALLPLGEPEVGRLLDTVAEDVRTQSWWIVHRDGSFVAGKSGAVAALLTQMHATRWLGRVVIVSGLSPLLDALDRLIARNRTRLSRLVPEGPAPRRFP
jgi:predicted DCC family thiol-disulfide oxidoreductase YuxK